MAIREIGLKRGHDWLKDEWLRPLLMIPFLLPLTIPTIDLIANHDAESITALTAMVWAAAASITYFIYRQAFRDSTVLCLIIFNGVIVILTLIGRILADGLDGLTEWTLLFAMAVLAVTTSAVVLTKHEIRSLATRPRLPTP